ncbi:MAG TPA: redoxin domain-containing protein [Sporichthyaceae bacterium]
MNLTQDLITIAEAEWLHRWTAGPQEDEGNPLPPGTPAPDLALLDHTGTERRLSEFWSTGPALLMFWRHYGCWCGFGRAARLRTDLARYLDAGLTPVIVSQGEPARAAAYHAEHDLPCPMLCDPEHDAYRAYGIGQWQLERILPDAPAEYWAHPRDLGVAFQEERRALGKPIVDDPWRAVKEFVVGRTGLVRLTYAYQHCEDYPNPAVLTAAARQS